MVSIEVMRNTYFFVGIGLELGEVINKAGPFILKRKKHHLKGFALIIIHGFVGMNMIVQTTKM